MQMRTEHSSLSADLQRWLKSKLRHIPPSKFLIMGIGNSLKADDGVASFICDKIKTCAPGRVIDAGTAPENYIQKIIDFSPQLLLIIDSMDFGGAAGEVRLFPADRISSVCSSTHSLDPGVFSSLIQQSCGTEIHYLGIQPQELTLGQPMSIPVKKAALKCVGCFVSAFTGQNVRRQHQDKEYS